MFLFVLLMLMACKPVNHTVSGDGTQLAIDSAQILGSGEASTVSVSDTLSIDTVVEITVSADQNQHSAPAKQKSHALAHVHEDTLTAYQDQQDADHNILDASTVRAVDPVEPSLEKVSLGETDTTTGSEIIETEDDEVLKAVNEGDIDTPRISKIEPVITLDVHHVWQVLLTKYVSVNGNVNYAALKNSEDQLDVYLAALQENVPSKDDKSKSAKAFWLNAYNAYTVKLILKNYPVKSIRDIDNGNPWDTKWILLGSDLLSLNYIEHSIIRPYWHDPRIHFAVNCAAKSCPPLSNTAFTKENVERELETLTRSYINNKLYNQIGTNKATVSKIFDWYKEDFGNLPAYLSRYTEKSLSPDVKIRFLEYDWALNN